MGTKGSKNKPLKQMTKNQNENQGAFIRNKYSKKLIANFIDFLPNEIPLCIVDCIAEYVYSITSMTLLNTFDKRLNMVLFKYNLNNNETNKSVVTNIMINESLNISLNLESHFKHKILKYDLVPDNYINNLNKFRYYIIHFTKKKFIDTFKCNNETLYMIDYAHIVSPIDRSLNITSCLKNRSNNNSQQLYTGLGLNQPNKIIIKCDSIRRPKVTPLGQSKEKLKEDCIDFRKIDHMYIKRIEMNISYKKEFYSFHDKHIIEGKYFNFIIDTLNSTYFDDNLDVTMHFFRDFGNRKSYPLHSHNMILKIQAVLCGNVIQFDLPRCENFEKL